MQATDIMTTNVATVGPSTTVTEIAKLLLERHVSAVPVVAEDGTLLGIVSEGDLVRRSETGTDERRSWWLELFASSHDRQERFIKSHGLHAENVMTPRPITVQPDTPVQEIAEILERNRIKRVPVTDGGNLVGIISRANLIQGLASAAPEISQAGSSDREIREVVMRRIVEDAGADILGLNVVVLDGVVQLWGVAKDDTEERAVVVAAETTPNVKAVESRIGRIPAWTYGY